MQQYSDCGIYVYKLKHFVRTHSTTLAIFLSDTFSSNGTYSAHDAFWQWREKGLNIPMTCGTNCGVLWTGSVVRDRIRWRERANNKASNIEKEGEEEGENLDIISFIYTAQQTNLSIYITFYRMCHALNLYLFKCFLCTAS